MSCWLQEITRISGQHIVGSLFLVVVMWRCRWAEFLFQEKMLFITKTL